MPINPSALQSSSDPLIKMAAEVLTARYPELVSPSGLRAAVVSSLPGNAAASYHDGLLGDSYKVNAGYTKGADYTTENVLNTVETLLHELGHKKISDTGTDVPKPASYKAERELSMSGLPSTRMETGTRLMNEVLASGYSNKMFERMGIAGTPATQQDARALSSAAALDPRISVIVQNLTKAQP